MKKIKKSSIFARIVRTIDEILDPDCMWDDDYSSIKCASVHMAWTTIFIIFFLASLIFVPLDYLYHVTFNVDVDI